MQMITTPSVAKAIGVCIMAYVMACYVYLFSFFPGAVSLNVWSVLLEMYFHFMVSLNQFDNSSVSTVRIAKHYRFLSVFMMYFILCVCTCHCLLGFVLSYWAEKKDPGAPDASKAGTETPRST
jgi:hypothetical protein